MPHPSYTLIFLVPVSLTLKENMAEEQLLRSIKLGFSKPLILWLLRSKPRSGYELIKEVMRLTGVKLKPSFIYPFLHSLERGGYLAGRWAERGRRRIKYYHVTEKGERLIQRIREIFKSGFGEVLLSL